MAPQALPHAGHAAGSAGHSAGWGDDADDALQGGDVVCVKARPGEHQTAAGMRCTNLSWCTPAGLCLTLGDFARGDTVHRALFRGGTHFAAVGQVVHVEDDNASLPPESSLVVFAAAQQQRVLGYTARATGSLAISGVGHHQAIVPVSKAPGVGAIQVEFTEPMNGRRVKMFGQYEGQVDPPDGAPHVTPVTCNAWRLRDHHKGAVFRHGRQAHCVYAGNLLGAEGSSSEAREWAACLNSSRVCALLPDLCTQQMD
eukprot:TRINITY_DN60963_c0_g1_i1.p1 TRINITY_DN60963_c0_g1~~TRINITY_DN60963_c0_g1_i1.p1  ORF type:complete len:256 (+),score=64.27 TRINITY_DN60963_c0_g1_i1:86-853(+)